MSIGRVIRGIRDRVPPGYVLGRASKGEGPVELLRVPGLTQPTGSGGASSIATDADIAAATAGLLSNTLTNTHIFVGNASNVATDVAMSGDATIANTGALTIANDAITTAKIINDAVSNAKLSNMAAWTVKMRNNAASGDPQDQTVSDLTEQATPVAGDMLFGWKADGTIRKFDVANVGSSGSSWVPTVDGSEPPVFITDGAGNLIFTAYP